MSFLALVLDNIVIIIRIISMSLRLAGKRLIQSAAQSGRTAMFSTSAVVRSPSSAAPSSKDAVIDLTFIDPSGARRKVPGLVGECE